MVYLGNTFSPMMLGEDTAVVVKETTLSDALSWLRFGFESIVSHEVTAKMLSAVLHQDVEFRRVNIVLKRGDVLVAIIPNFRASEAREFTEEEVLGAGIRCFLIV